jgi:hypothetical protein
VPVEATCARGYTCASGGACAQWRLPVPVEVPVLVQGRGVVHVNDGHEGVGDHSTTGGWRGYQGQTQVLNMNQIKENSFNYFVWTPMGSRVKIKKKNFFLFTLKCKQSDTVPIICHRCC